MISGKRYLQCDGLGEVDELDEAGGLPVGGRSRGLCCKVKE